MNNINLGNLLSVSDTLSKYLSYVGLDSLTTTITLDNAWYLLLFVPLFFLAVIPFAAVIRKTNRKWYNVCSCILHVILAIIIAFAAAGVIIETTLTETTVYVVADVSYSANKNLDEVDEYIYQIRDNLPKNTKLGVVVFGKDYEINTKLVQTFSTVQNNNVDDTGTDIASAIKYTATLYKSTVIKRMVVITDGKQTNSTDSELRSAVQYCEENSIRVDAIYLDDNIDYDNDYEVQMTSVSCNNTAYMGHESSASALIQSTYVTSAQIDLIQVNDDGSTSIVSTTEEYLGVGSNEISIALPTDRTEGTYNYNLKVTDAKDTSAYNNTVAFSQNVTSAVKILFISEDEDDENAVQDTETGLFSGVEGVTIDTYCTINYSTDGFEVPTNIEELSTYDIIVLSNVDVTHIDQYETFVDNLELVVSTLGKSLIAIGDLHLQEVSHDEALIKLAAMLPVSYGSPTLEGTAFTILIDCSLSMLSNSALVRAKSVAKALINILSTDDYVYIYIFYSETDSELYAGQANSTAETWIDENVTPHQGTSYTRAFQTAQDRITSMSNYSSNAVFLITDGDTESETFSTVQSSITPFVEANITVSVVNVAATTASANSILYSIANYAGGSVYDYTSDDDTVLESVMDSISESEVAEAYVTSTSVVYIKARYYNDDVLSGISSTSNGYSLYSVRGYVLARTKSSASAILTAQYKAVGISTTYEVPIYAYQGYGNGKTAAYTSYISATSNQVINGEYISSLGVDYTSSTFYTNVLDKFITNVVNTSIPDERIASPYTVTITESAGTYTVLITPLKITTSTLTADVSVTVTMADGSVLYISRTGGTLTYYDDEEETYVTEDVSNRVSFYASYFSCTFEADELGTYVITTTFTMEATDYGSNTSFISLSYLDEYNAFENFSPSLLYLILGSSGEVNTTGDYVVTIDDSEVAKEYVSIAIPLLIAAVSLFVIDIFIRKIRWADILSLFGVVNRRAKKEREAKLMQGGAK